MDLKALESVITSIVRQGQEHAAIKPLLNSAQSTAELPDEIIRAIASLAVRDRRVGTDSLIRTISAGWC
jgi:hypothetical protein